jgi:hypothetical protein
MFETTHVPTHFGKVSMNRKVLGVDVGLVGAVALLTTEDGNSLELLRIIDTPTLCDGPGKRRSINAPKYRTISCVLRSSCPVGATKGSMDSH